MMDSIGTTSIRKRLLRRRNKVQKLYHQCFVYLVLKCYIPDENLVQDSRFLSLTIVQVNNMFSTLGTFAPSEAVNIIMIICDHARAYIVLFQAVAMELQSRKKIFN